MSFILRLWLTENTESVLVCFMFSFSPHSVNFEFKKANRNLPINLSAYLDGKKLEMATKIHVPMTGYSAM